MPCARWRGGVGRADQAEPPQTGAEEHTDALEFLARVIAHIHEP